MGSTSNKSAGASRTTATTMPAAYTWTVYRQPDAQRPELQDVLASGVSDDWASALRAAEKSAGWDRSAALPLAPVPDSARGVLVSVRRLNGRVTVFPMI